MLERTKAAIKIQSFVKAVRTRTQYLTLKRAAICLQALTRGNCLSLSICKHSMTYG